jgi:uncharacterized protein YkwD
MSPARHGPSTSHRDHRRDADGYPYDGHDRTRARRGAHGSGQREVPRPGGDAYWGGVQEERPAWPAPDAGGHTDRGWPDRYPSPDGGSAVPRSARHGSPTASGPREHRRLAEAHRPEARDRREPGDGPDLPGAGGGHRGDRAPGHHGRWIRVVLSVVVVLVVAYGLLYLAEDHMPFTSGGVSSGNAAASSSTAVTGAGRPHASPPARTSPAQRASGNGGPSAHPGGPTPGTAPSTPPALSPQQQVLNLINQARAAQGLPAYVLSNGLTVSATAHNQRMAGGCGLSHQCPGEEPLGAREQAAGVTWSAAGENVGDGGPVADTQAAQASMALSLTRSMLAEQPPNDGHRANILSSSYHYVGIAVDIDSHGTVWLTQDFSN